MGVGHRGTWPGPRAAGHRPCNIRICDRLSDQDIAQLIASFKAGTPKRILAEQFGSGIKSVKKLLRERGVRRRSRYDLLPSLVLPDPTVSSASSHPCSD